MTDCNMEIYHQIRMDTAYSVAENGFMVACISSSVLPLVSGTSLVTNRMVNPPLLANMKNVPER